MSESVRRGIPTVYGGIEFRSRLEARWAAFFDEIGWRWSYEPFDGDGYIPDFLIHGERPMLVEVKPFHARQQWRPVIHRVRDGIKGLWKQDILYLGIEPTAGADNDQFEGALGVLDEYIYCDFHESEDDYHDLWTDEDACLAKCLGCGTFAVFHSVQSYACRPCGHSGGDHYLGRAWDWKMPWAAATNAVKWASR